MITSTLLVTAIVYFLPNRPFRVFGHLEQRLRSRSQVLRSVILCRRAPGSRRTLSDTYYYLTTTFASELRQLSCLVSFRLIPSVFGCLPSIRVLTSTNRFSVQQLANAESRLLPFIASDLVDKHPLDFNILPGPSTLPFGSCDSFPSFVYMPIFSAIDLGPHKP
ncbi:hypothetical protein FPOAC1_008118 [Fusarium poae]|uniref:hypothetical protein n=1 Tax=Fusarium poae TaxID=36050 RepID=UPI001CEA8927|nr:hypothetical protein FPOAC1_008118 [Fusarium poae]KAG8668734.1 hypothetical protein FPOAC1_008118 [Fusarium poae]